MTRAFLREFFFILFAAAALSADTTLVDNQLNYRMFLPNNWVREVYNDTQHFFFDTTFIYPAQLSFKRYTIDSTLYSSAAEWVQAHFIAYKLSVQYSVDPAGVVLYSNADTSVKQGTLQACETYSVFFSSDTNIGSWSEYVRFTAYGRFGYELYAISDTADMSKNIGLYATLLQGIVIVPTNRIISPRAFYRNVSSAQRIFSPFLYDPLGREIRSLTASRNLATGVYVRKKSIPRFHVR